MDAQYQDDNGVFEENKVYDILAISLSNDIEEAIDALANLMGGNGWDELNIEKCSEIGNSDHLPQSISSKPNWKKDLEESGAIYIVYK
mgnify:FL=1